MYFKVVSSKDIKITEDTGSLRLSVNIAGTSKEAKVPNGWTTIIGH